MNLLVFSNVYYFSVLIIGLYYTIYGVLLFINNKKSLDLDIFKEYENKTFESNNKDFANFIILIPVLREQKVIKETLALFSSLNYNLNKLKVVVVTTQREITEMNFHRDQLMPSTIEITKNNIVLLNKKLGKKVFYHIHYPYNQGVKSDQLNYALKELLIKDPKIYKNKSLYIGIYDADSKINANVLKILSNDAIKNNLPLVYQQPTVYFKNFNKLPNTINGLFMKSFALWQTRYALGYEIPMFLDSTGNSRRLLKKMQYCIGHGLFIRADFLKKINFFPTPIEDTRIGHIFSYLGQEIRLLPSFESVEVTNKLSRLIKQTSIWFIGENYIVKDFKIANKIKNIINIRSFFLIIYKSFKNLLWATEGLVFITITIVGLLLPNKIPFLIFLFGMISYFYLSAFYLLAKHEQLEKITNGLINFKPTKVDFLFNILFLPLNGFLLFLGPQLAIFRLIFIRKNILPKTER